MRALISGIAVVAVLFTGSVIWLGSGSSNRGIVSAIEEAGSQATGTDVTVSGGDISPQFGTARFRGIKIDNPPDYPGGTAIAVRKLNVKFEKQLEGDTLLIKSLIAYDVTIHYKSGNRRSNVSALANLARNHRQRARPSSRNGRPLRIKIAELDLNTPRVRLRESAGITAVVTLPELTLSGIGGDQDNPVALGLTAGDVMALVLDALSDEAEKAIAAYEAEY